LLKVVLDKEARTRVGRQGLQSVQDRGFLWETNAKKVLALLFPSQTALRASTCHSESLCGSASIASR
jgi:hypothetical protein